LTLFPREEVKALINEALALPALIQLPYTFSPVMKDGEIISIKVINKGRVLLTLKDSIKILPGSLAKLAKDWGTETQKDHGGPITFGITVLNTL